MKKLFLSISVFTLLAASCSDDNDPVTVTVQPNNAALTYNEDNVWTGLKAKEPFFIQNIEFAHYSDINPWGLSWKGFTPARVTETAAQTNWLDHQFQIPTGGGVSGTGTPYIVCFWDTQETDVTDLKSRSCLIRCREHISAVGRDFRPISVKVINTSYTLATMQEGNPFSKKFEAGDYLRLIAHGVHADDSESTVAFSLASGTDFVQTWTTMDLSSLGSIKALYFTMESSDSGQWGMNTPSYFAIDELIYTAVI